MDWKINGYPVVAHVKTNRQNGTRPGAFVIVDRGAEKNIGPGRYVVAWSGDGDDCWHGGTYCDEMADAVSELARRVKNWPWAADLPADAV